MDMELQHLIPTLHGAMRSLAGVCDGAVQQDGAGFAKNHASVGHYLARLDVAQWDEDAVLAGLRLAQHYRRQLELDLPEFVCGDDQWAAVLERAREHARRPVLTLDRERLRLLVTAPYDGERVAVIRAIPGRGWNGESDTFPLESLADVRAALAPFGVIEEEFNDADVAAALVARGAAQAAAASAAAAAKDTRASLLWNDDTGLLELRGGYDADRVALSREIPGRRWNGECETFPAGAYRAVLGALGGMVRDAVEPAVQERLRTVAPPTEGLHREGGEILLRAAFGPSRAFGERARTRWDRERSVRVLGEGEDLLAAVELAQDLGLAVSEELLSEVQAGRESAERALRLRASALDVPLPAGLVTAPYPHQRVVAPIWRETRRMLLADEQGLGKTLEAISALLADRAAGETVRAVVVCPTNLTLNWLREFEVHAPGQFQTQLLRGRTAGAIEPDTAVAVIGWDVLGAWRDTLLPWAGTLIVDEGQAGKKRTSGRGAAVQDIAAAVRARGGGVMVLSGTPCDERPLDAAALLEALGVLSEFGGDYAYRQRYCGPVSKGVVWNRHLEREMEAFTYVGASNTAELGDRLAGRPWYLRRTKRMLIEAGQMGRKTVNGRAEEDVDGAEAPVRVALPPAALADYNAAVSAFVDAVEGFGSAEELAGELQQVLPHLTRLRQIVGRGKVEAVVAHVRALNARGEQVVVIAHHREVVDALARELCGPRTLKIQGGMTTRAVEEAKAFFNTHGVQEAPVMVLSIQAGKLGHTLCLQRRLAGLPECRHVVIAEETFSAGAEAQAMDRVHRLPQSRDVVVENVVARGTVDEGMRALRRDKRLAAAAIVDDEAVDGDSPLAGMLSAWLYRLAGEMRSEQTERGTHEQEKMCL